MAGIAGKAFEQYMYVYMYIGLCSDNRAGSGGRRAAGRKQRDNGTTGMPRYTTTVFSHSGTLSPSLSLSLSPRLSFILALYLPLTLSFSLCVYVPLSVDIVSTCL